MGLTREEAAQRLKSGDIAFILDSPPDAMGELTRLHVSAPYYAGLLVKAKGGEESEARAPALFEAGLSGKGRLQREAAGELMRFILAGDARRSSLEAKGRAPAILSLRAACLYKLGRFAEIEALYKGAGPSFEPGPWDRAFSLLAALFADSGEREIAGAAADFFLGRTSPSAGSGASPEEARRWALGELGGRNAGRLAEAAGSAVAAAAAGHVAVVRSAYGEGLVHFRTVLEEDEGLFFRYPALLTDLGRAFQFGSSPNEGMRLFQDWDARIQGGELKYLILYYAGRIQRQLRRYAQASEYFARALDFAPDALQSDACIWYILSMSLQEQPGETAALIGRYISRWRQDDYFADILDRLARYLIAKRRWDTLAEVFSLIEPRSDGASIAKYAYILGRAVSEGFISAAPRPPEEYFKVALAQGNAPFYYRVMAASRLGAATLPAGEGKEPPDQGANADDMEFLRGFFEYGAADLAFAFIKDDTDRFSPGELRTLAAAFAKAEHWEESIRVVTAYAGRPGYVMKKQDLVLYYPRAFADLVEAHAADAEIPVELLFGLIRTESAFAPGIRSRVGAAGLTQLMPATAREMADRIRRRGGPNYTEGGEIDLENPAANIHLGAVYLRYLMDRAESPMMALLAYNGGMGRLRRWRNAEPKLPGDLFLETIEYPETREYGRKVLSAAAAYGYLYYDMTMEAVVADIYR